MLIRSNELENTRLVAPQTIRLEDINRLSSIDRFNYLISHYYNPQFNTVSLGSDEISKNLARSFYHAADVYEVVGILPGNSTLIYPFIQSITKQFFRDHQRIVRSSANPLIRVLMSCYEIDTLVINEKLSELIRLHSDNANIQACAEGVALSLTLRDKSLSAEDRQHAFREFNSKVYIKIHTLVNFDFSHHDLTRCNFTQSTLSKSTFHHCLFGSLDGTNLSSADMAQANFSDTIINRCTFINANVSGATFENATFDYSHIRGMNASNANFRGANFIDMLREGNFTDTTFEGADLSNVTWFKKDELRFRSRMIKEDLQNIFNIIAVSHSKQLLAESICQSIKSIIQDLILADKSEDALLLVTEALESDLIKCIKKGNSMPTLFNNTNTPSILNDMIALKSTIESTVPVSVKQRSLMFK